MRLPIALALLLALAACGEQPEQREASAPSSASPAPALRPMGSPAGAARPDLAKCERLDPAEREAGGREAPLPIPPQFAAFAAADMDHVAVSTQAGATICADARYQDSALDFRTYQDGRFLGYAWYGYEANGFQLFDRAGEGKVIDTGAAPVFSPSGKRFGSVEWSASGFGALNAVLVMEVLPGGLKELTRFEQLPELSGDWHIERWRGEDCFELTAEIEAKPSPFMMRRTANGWALSAAPQGCPAG